MRTQILKKQLAERKDLVAAMYQNRAEFAKEDNMTAVAKYTELIAEQEAIIAVLEEETK